MQYTKFFICLLLISSCGGGDSHDHGSTDECCGEGGECCKSEEECCGEGGECCKSETDASE